MRYTARDDLLFALVQARSETATLREVRPTPTTVVSSPAGAPLSWRDSPDGLVVDLPARAPESDPVALTLCNVEGRAV